MATSPAHQLQQPPARPVTGHVVNLTPTAPPTAGRLQPPHLGRRGATHDAGQYSDHVHGNGVCVLVQYLGVGGAVRRSRSQGIAAGSALQ